MTHQKEQRGFSNLGFTSILLSFVMICVVTFSALSLVTAYSDYKLSKKVAAQTTGYYEAQEQAYEQLAAIDRLLIDIYTTTTDETDYYSNLEKELVRYGQLDRAPSGYYLSFVEPISEVNYLSVKLSLVYPKDNADTFYDILEWKSVFERDIPEEEPLHLMQ